MDEAKEKSKKRRETRAEKARVSIRRFDGWKKIKERNKQQKKETEGSKVE